MFEFYRKLLERKMASVGKNEKKSQLATILCANLACESLSNRLLISPYFGIVFASLEVVVMISTIQPKIQKKVRMPVPIEGLISILHNIQSKIDAAAGIATALELRLRIIAQLNDSVREELRKKTNKPFHRADLEHLISSVLKVFQDNLDP